uniref:Dynein light chain roadblock-type 2 n=1 Tax=Xiphophorus maculatus TaxID=8083 RepID=A0A3B5QVK7_XIPMA
MADVEETLKRIEGHKGVIGTIIVNSEGLPIRTTLDNSTTSLYARLLRSFTTLARSAVRDVDPQNDLTFVRIRSKKQEILVAPGEISVHFIAHKLFIAKLIVLLFLPQFFLSLQRTTIYWLLSKTHLNSCQISSLRHMMGYFQENFLRHIIPLFCSACVAF